MKLTHDEKRTILLNAAGKVHRSPTDENKEALFVAITDFFTPPPGPACSVCGKTEEQNDDEGWGPLVPVRVVVADGEEGWADVTRWYCNDHAVEVFPALMALGFVSHRHGGANFLEPEDCPGYRSMEACPTPDEDD